jgi:hypothetical protein
MNALNGRFWQKCSLETKVGFVVGFDSAMHASVTMSKQELEKYGSKLSYGEMVKGIDQIYEKPGNDALLPIWVAIRIVTLKAKGVPEDKIAEALVADGVWRVVTDKK